MPPFRNVSVCWNDETTPPELHSILETLSSHYPIRHNRKNGIQVQFEKTAKSGVCKLTLKDKCATIRYGSPALAMRALNALMAGLAPKGRELIEKSSFSTFGIMLDCSRNAVMTVEHFKKWLRHLALLGYNMAMLYTEDTYELPGEPNFGRLRGRYTAGELCEIDDYAASLGIEMVPCIQTLGHLSQILQWPAYREVKDTDSVLLVDEPKTYALIEKMIAHWSQVFKSRRIHIGMDEAGDLGRGQYLSKHGFERPFDLFNRHLDCVVRICKDYDLNPMIWSDMYFSLGSACGDYYDPKCKIPKDVINKIPADVELVYWDYYHKDAAFYRDWIEKHRALGSEPLMASGIWTWSRLWYDQRRTEETAGPCIEACKKEGLREIIFTMWGDNGAYCDFDSAIAGMAFCAEKAYAKKISKTALSTRFRSVCGSDYAAQTLASKLGYAAGQYQLPANILWDDPLLAVFLTSKQSSLRKLETHYASLATQLKQYQRDSGAGDIRHARLLAETLSEKLAMSRYLLAAYSAGDRAALSAVRKGIPSLVRRLEKVADSFRKVWLRQNKPIGLEVLQARMASVIARCRELDLRLSEYLAGEVTDIPELEARKLPSKRRGHPNVGGNYRHCATASTIL